MATYASLAELKAFLRITDTTDDVLLQLALDAATEAIDVALGVNRAQSEFAVTLATSAAADDIIDTATTHGFVAGNLVRFTSLTGGAGLTVGVDYYVLSTNLAATTFQVALWSGGTAIDFTTNITAGAVWRPISQSVKLACEIQATRWYKRQDSPYGVLGSPEFGNYTRLLSSLDPDVMTMLDGHGERTSWGTV